MVPEEPIVSPVMPSAGSVIKTEHIDDDPSAQGAAEVLSETVRDVLENTDSWAFDSEEPAVLHHDVTPSEPHVNYEAMTSDAVPEDEVKYVHGSVPEDEQHVIRDIIPAEDASQCFDCIPNNSVVQDEDVCVKTEPTNILPTNLPSFDEQKDGTELQHRPPHTDDSDQNKTTVHTVLQHEAQCTDAVLQNDSVANNNDFQQEAAHTVDELTLEASPDDTVLQNEAASNDSVIKQVSDDTNCDVEIRDSKTGLEEREIETGIVRSSVEVSDKDQMDSVLSAAESNEVSLQDSLTSATVASSAAATLLKNDGTVGRDAADDSTSSDLVSDSSEEQPAVCDEAGKFDDFIPAESSPQTVAGSSDTLSICNCQDVADQDGPSACPEMTDECSAVDGGSARSFLLCLLLV